MRVRPRPDARAARRYQTAHDQLPHRAHRNRRRRPRPLLFSHSPFEKIGPYKEVGAVFAHERACERAEPRAVPDQLRRRLLALRGYSADQRILAADVVPGAEMEALLVQLLRDPKVAYVHARFAKFGCFACRIDRA